MTTILIYVWFRILFSYIIVCILIIMINVVLFPNVRPNTAKPVQLRVEIINSQII